MRLQMPEEELKSFARQQMDRNRIAGECIDRQDIEALHRLAFQRQACIAHGDFDLARCVFQIGEIRIGNLQHDRIDFVDVDRIAGAPVTGKSASAKADHADTLRHALIARQHCFADAGRRAIIGGLFAASFLCSDLRAVLDWVEKAKR